MLDMQLKYECPNIVSQHLLDGIVGCPAEIPTLLSNINFVGCVAEL